MSHTIRLTVPTDYKLPAFYAQADPRTVSLALNLGAEAYETLHEKTLQCARSETHSDIMRNVQTEYKREVEVIQAEMQQQLKRIRQEKTRAEEACAAASARLEAMELSASGLRGQIQRETKEAFQELVTAKDEQIAHLQQTLEKRMEAVAGRMDVLQTSITKTFTSSKEKGTFGELFMEGFLKKAFDCSIQTVSKDAQTADIRMQRTPEHEYFWEVKNYTRMVTSEEVEKFRRDMRLHPSIRGGVLASLRTGIVGKTRGGDIDIEFLEDGRFILFLSNLLSKDDIVFYLQTLRPFFQVVESFSKPAITESDTVRTLELKTNLITNLLRSHASSVGKHRNSLLSHKKRTDAMFAEFQSYILESEAQLQTLLRVALGDEGESEDVAKDTETFLPSTVFQRHRLSDCEGRTKAFVSWLIEATDAGEGTQIEIKEVLERAKGVGFSEKFVRDLREEMFHPVAWAKGSRYLMGLAWK
jgi:hypothetical protein